MDALGFLGFAMTATAGFLLVCAVVFAVLFEISEILEERDVRRRIAEDDEIADLDFLWNLPAAAPSLPMRPAKHTSRNRLHRGF
jgi:hypothetical protein